MIASRAGAVLSPRPTYEGHPRWSILTRAPRAQTARPPSRKRRNRPGPRLAPGATRLHGHKTLDEKLADLPIPLHNPAILQEQARRAADIQLRIADWITGFAGSMNFVYLHIALFTAWMLFIEKSPWPTLTLIVSLEAIFLSTFVMIGQNRQSAFQQAKADRDFTEQELELKTNTQLTREIDRLTTEVHRRLMGDPSR